MSIEQNQLPVPVAKQPSSKLLWIPNVNAEQRRNFWAAFMGYVLDAMDYLLYAMVIVLLIKEFHLNPALAAFLATASLMAAAAGGLVFGVLTDYLGRSKVLMITVLVYSVASLGAATSQTWQQLLIWRILLGLGMGGEWGAGMALVTETFTKTTRGRGVALVQAAWPVGYICATIASFLIVPYFGWRGLFAFGILPALLVFWIRRHIKEPELWQQNKITKVSKEKHEGSANLLVKGLFGRSIIKTTLIASGLTIFGYLGYGAISVWLPTFLTGAKNMGGLAMERNTSTFMLLAYNLGGVILYPIYGILQDRFGRKPMLLTFIAAFTALVLIDYLYLVHLDSWGPLYIGMFLVGGASAFFCYFGVGISELFATNVRGSALGFVNNIGRILGGQAPVLIGLLTAAYGFGVGMTIIAVIGSVFTFVFALGIRETNGMELK